MRAQGGRKVLREIVTTCEAIEQRRFNPFFLDVGHVLDTIRLYLPIWESMDDHCLDAHAINKVAAVVKLQNIQLRFQSTTLYTDPEFMREKIRLLTRRHLAEALLKSWHPVVELEQLSEGAIREASDYWNSLSSFRERLRRFEESQVRVPGKVSLEELADLGLLSQQDFARKLEELQTELRKVRRIEYWKFIKARSYDETVERAYLTSFLVSYGHAQLKRGDVLELVALEKELRPSDYVSFPISLEAVASV